MLALDMTSNSVLPCGYHPTSRDRTGDHRIPVVSRCDIASDTCDRVGDPCRWGVAGRVETPLVGSPEDLHELDAPWRMSIDVVLSSEVTGHGLVFVGAESTEVARISHRPRELLPEDHAVQDVAVTIQHHFGSRPSDVVLQGFQKLVDVPRRAVCLEEFDQATSPLIKTPPSSSVHFLS